MSTRRPGACGEPGSRDAHCTLDRMHDYSCYDAGEDVSWNHHQWYDFDLAPHACADPTCPDQGYRGPEGRESEYGRDAEPGARRPGGPVSHRSDHVPLPAELQKAARA